MEKHLADGLEVEARVVEERQVEELVAVALEQQVVGDLRRGGAEPLRDRRDARLGTGLVVGRVAEREELVKRRRDVGENRIRERDLLLEDAPPGLRVAHAAHALRERKVLQLL